jgi:hypothetical protein
MELSQDAAPLVAVRSVHEQRGWSACNAAVEANLPLRRGSFSRPSQTALKDVFEFTTALPLDTRFVQSDNTSAVFCSSVDRGPYQENAVNQLPDFPGGIMDVNWDLATRPRFFYPSLSDTSSDDSVPTNPDDVVDAARLFDRTELYNFDYEGPHGRFLNLDGSPRPPVGTWKGHIQSTLHIWTGPDVPNIFTGQ